MKISIHDIEEAPKVLDYREPTEALNALLLHGDVQDFEFQPEVDVHVSYQRSGTELIFLGSVEGDATGHCARCLEPYPFHCSSDFSFVLTPKPAASDDDDLDAEDVDFGFYEGDEVDLSPLMRERLILTLPTKPLCADTCKGLCPQCGVNRNLQSCDCNEFRGDPRLAVLRNLKVSH